MINFKQEVDGFSIEGIPLCIEKTLGGKFLAFSTDLKNPECEISAHYLRSIADKLDELNKPKSYDTEKLVTNMLAESMGYWGNHWNRLNDSISPELSSKERLSICNYLALFATRVKSCEDWLNDNEAEKA